VELPAGFSSDEFMVNIGLALKELLPEKAEANFSIVNFNALPEAYVPPRFSMVRVLLPVVTIIGIGLIVLAVILILTNRASIESLHSDVTFAETSVTQQQQAITALTKQIGPTTATADALNAQLTTMERGRATFHEDLTEIERLAREQVILKSINHGGSSVTVKGTASNEDAIFRYAEDLRALTDATNALRFSGVWISSISGSGSTFSFQFSLTK
jgi:Tfp pilus assembly protein PilN